MDITSVDTTSVDTTSVDKENMWDDESNVDQLIREHDDTCMPLPSIDSEPHVLISKVRKHYMDYMVKLLTANYERNQRLVNKNIYLPSGIWRCAKIMETKAAQDCMVTHLYRQSLLLMIKELKKDTSKGKLNKRLYECLHWPPENEKNVQISKGNTDECSCQCTCQNSKKKKKLSRNGDRKQLDKKSDSQLCYTTTDYFQDEDISAPQVSSTKDSHPDNDNIDNSPNLTEPALLLDTHSQESDDLMTQLEKLFHSDPNDDDLFDTVFSDAIDSSLNKLPNGTCESSADQNTASAVDTHAAQIKSLDERLTSLAGLWKNSAENRPSVNNSQADKPKKFISSKWNCEEHFLKTKFYNLLDQIGEYDGKQLDRVKEMLYELFGEDSDDEGLVSPMEETPEFIISCKERIAPWVVETLTPFYVKGCIDGKALFKLLAKHLIRLILKCSHYPARHEVHGFVNDFLKSHETIRCEADFKQFKIANI